MLPARRLTKNGLATARDNVAIRFGDTDIYSDFAQYDSAKRTVYLQGHVRIYRGVTLYMGEKATYNLDTKAISAEEMRSGTYPYLLSGKTVTSDSDEEYTIKNGSFTTDDSSQPDFHLNAQSVRIYQNDRSHLQERHFLHRPDAGFLVALSLSVARPLLQLFRSCPPILVRGGRRFSAKSLSRSARKSSAR